MKIAAEFEDQVHFPRGLLIYSIFHLNRCCFHPTFQAGSAPSLVPLTEFPQFPAYLGPDQLPACLLSLPVEVFLELLSLALFFSQAGLQLLKLFLWHHVVHLGLGLLQLPCMPSLSQVQACFGS